MTHSSYEMTWPSYERAVGHNETGTDRAIPFVGPQMAGKVQRQAIASGQQSIGQAPVPRPEHHGFQPWAATLTFDEHPDRSRFLAHPIGPHDARIYRFPLA